MRRTGAHELDSSPRGRACLDLGFSSTVPRASRMIAPEGRAGAEDRRHELDSCSWIRECKATDLRASRMLAPEGRASAEERPARIGFRLT